MIDLTKYGYKSRAAFLRDTPSMQTFIDISNDSNWGIAKSVLLHKHCPIDILDLPNLIFGINVLLRISHLLHLQGFLNWLRMIWNVIYKEFIKNT